MQKTFIGTLAAGWVGIVLMFANSIVIADADKKLPAGNSLLKPGLHGARLQTGPEGRCEPHVPAVAETGSSTSAGPNG
jgi:hypothetical protein